MAHGIPLAADCADDGDQDDETDDSETNNAELQRANHRAFAAALSSIVKPNGQK